MYEEKHRLKLKVCGLTQLQQIDELISMNTDFLGFIFYEKSPRYALNHLSLREISEVEHPGKVGVFVNEILERIIEISEKANLNFIQLHGDESKDFIAELRRKLHPEIKIIKVIRVGNQSLQGRNLTEQLMSFSLSDMDYFLFDTDSKAFGGTGKTFDWNILKSLKIPLPYFLSGGISEENIGHINSLHTKPFAVDINSKFEAVPGIKNTERIKLFKEKYTIL
ncbi:phosphoribosylanthranilate isomerase [Chryseobacterium sp. SSA4.19]|uniref:phosphoribosylanthranilate isomerase n=1 Tax=Chryseobacterium sp. SSA4.19 TaxID=2919915 RepID=UPI001F4E9DF9|nr:phosphoribosylanthranilate isomerase [Chryseobacterium sp. SSA4.19]MCJ8153831.1 phosphoribosylanthranilate isomerase [Chryseobacterium sp. SSA4.19]